MDRFFLSSNFETVLAWAQVQSRREKDEKQLKILKVIGVDL